jgi:aspartate aminotransferase-like enzyme
MPDLSRSFSIPIFIWVFPHLPMAEWSIAEQALFAQGQQHHHQQYFRIAQVVGTKTPEQVRAHAQEQNRAIYRAAYERVQGLGLPAGAREGT